MKVVAIDLDGVILKFDEWRGVDHFGEPIEGARLALEKLKEMGFEIIIYTNRTNPGTNPGYTKYMLAAKVEKALRQHDIPFDKIELSGKPLAKYYIDDRAIRFEGEWSHLLWQIESLENPE